MFILEALSGKPSSGTRQIRRSECFGMFESLLCQFPVACGNTGLHPVLPGDVYLGTMGVFHCRCDVERRAGTQACLYAGNYIGYGFN
ncbi:hypothetical protein Pan110_21220 [Gimesia panareensis]|nr:hypothetical protein Pan110_21220 [Gimesia panareensis]